MFLVPAVHIELTDVVHGYLGLLQLDLVRVRCKFAGEVTDGVWEGGRKENNLYRVLPRKHAVGGEVNTRVQKLPLGRTS